jgi:hypothetical protein
MNKSGIQRPQFLAWLSTQGAEVLPSTNPYEFARFLARDGLHIIYRDKRGTFNATSQDGGNFSAECLAAFHRGANIGMGNTTPRRPIRHRKKAALMERDGNACFFCLRPMETEEDITVEHLVAKLRGGPDHTDNMALAHRRCNQQANNAPLMDKIRIHVAAQIKNAGADLKSDPAREPPQPPQSGAAK